MASSGAMADFARMPPQRKVLVFVVIGGLIGLVYWKLAYKSLEDQLESAQVVHDNQLATNRQLAENIPKYEELRTHMTRLKELIEKNQTALPSAPELPAFFETLQHKVAESGVEISKWTNRNEEPVESFIKVPIEIEISGTFMQIKRFFASLIQRDVRPAAGADDRSADDRERIVSIENLTLGSPTVKNREIILLAKFTAVTFRQEDRPAPDKPAPGGRPLAPPSPAAPAAAPPPLPSSATPPGAKARTEDTLDKGDPRNRKATGAADGKATGSDRLKGGL